MIEAKVEVVGPTVDEMYEDDLEETGELLLASARAAIDRSGIYRKTRHLRDGLVVVRAGDGFDLIPPPDRLLEREVRQGFINLIRQWTR